jgi:WD40 repeat protein
MGRHTLTLALVLALAPCQGSPAQELQERASLKGHPLFTDCVALSPDGKTVATGGRKRRGGELRLWDVSSGKEVTTLTLPRDSPQILGFSVLGFSADGRFLAAAGHGTVAVWDVAARKQLPLKGHVAPANTLAFSPDGKRLGVAGENGVRLWDVTSGRELSSFRLLVPASGWPALAFSKDLRTLAAPNYQEIDLWDTDTGKVRAVLSEHRGQVCCVAYSPDGKTLVAASMLYRGGRKDTGDIRLWDVATGRERAVFEEGLGHVRAARLSPDGATLAVVDRVGLDDEFDLKLLAVPTGHRRVFRYVPGHSFTSIAFTADGRLFVTGTPDNRAIKLWEIVQPKRRGR